MSKFCTNCGNAVEENEQFCNNCGTALNETAQAPAQAAPISLKVPDFKDNKVIAYLIAAGALLLQFIFYFVGGYTVSVSFMGFEQSASATFADALSADVSFINVLTILFFVVGIIVAVADLFSLIPAVVPKKIVALVPGIAAVWGVLWYVIEWFSAQPEGMPASVDASVAPDFCGILFILLGVAVAFFSFKNFKEAQKA